MMLHTAPSFSIFNTSNEVEDEEKVGKTTEELLKIDSGEFSFGNMSLMSINEKEEEGDPSYLKSYAQVLQAKGDLQGAEEYYSRAILADPKDGEMKSQYAKLVWELHRDQDKASSYFEQALEAIPGDSNLLAAYAFFLWEAEDKDMKESSTDQENMHQGGVKSSKEDELEYYLHAMLADPEDGNIISQYAKLCWELNHDRRKASSYFQRAVQAAPGDCNVLAAYASFLWEMEEEEEEEDNKEQNSHFLIGN